MKDAKGHGSNPRGGGKDQRGLEKRHGLKPGSLADPKARAAYRASEALKRGDFVAADAIRRSVGLPGGNADRAAARQLASGPKSAPAPVHDAMNETPHVVKDTSVKGATHALVKRDGTVVGRLYKKGSPAWR